MKKRTAAKLRHRRDVSLLAIRHLCEALNKTSHKTYSLADKPAVDLVTQTTDFSVCDGLSGDEAARAFAVEYLLTEGVSKIEFLDFGIDKADVALKKFLEAEASCRQTNERLAKRSFTAGFSPESVISTAADKISSLLGEFSWDDASEHFGFGIGASTRLPRSKGRASYKYSGTPEVTPNCEALGVAAMTLVPSWNCVLSPEGGTVPQAGQLAVVWGNRLDTVPKNAKTDRMIAIEPCMNMYVQKGIGELLRRKLKRVGVNLDDQGKNQYLALVGSRDGSLATIDLSMASDSVSQMLTSRLLPESWVDAIELTRSTHGVLPDGTIHQYQKVSSMGNGFTFELESLIFWGLLQACNSLFGGSDQRFAVYGDDLICPISYSASVLWILGYCGFQPNEKKTFQSGPFRESCGKHYYEGVDVTPFYFKEALTTDHSVYRVFNRYREWKTRLFGWSEDVFSNYLRSLVARPALVPFGVGDCGFVSEFDEAHPVPYRPAEHFEGWLIRALLPRMSTDPSSCPQGGLFTEALLRAGHTSYSVKTLLRQARLGKRISMLDRSGELLRPDGYKYGRMVVWQWRSPGLSV